VIKHTGRQTRESQAAVEKRVHALEGRVTALAEAVRVLAHGLDLEDLPTAEPGGTGVNGQIGQAVARLVSGDVRPA
jgi:hypothetical protein